MNMRNVFLLLLSTLLTTGCDAQERLTGRISPEREAAIIDNLKLEFPQLREAGVALSELEEAEIEGFVQGSLLLNGGQQRQAFLLSEDGKTMLLLAAEPINVGRTSAEIEAALADEEQAAARQTEERHEALLELAAGEPVRGPQDAPITVIEFSDFQCPYCARAHETMQQVLERYPQDVRLIYMHYPLPNHEWARPAAIASVCAAKQSDEVFWQLHDAYFEHRASLDASNVLARSREFLAGTGIDLAQWSTCAEDTTSDAYASAAETVDQQFEAGNVFGVTGTPGFFINGHLVSGAQPLTEFERVIEQVKQDRTGARN